jgi:hypothetical protein
VVVRFVAVPKLHHLSPILAREILPSLQDILLYKYKATVAAANRGTRFDIDRAPW